MIGFIAAVVIWIILFALLWALVNALPVSDPWKKWCQIAVIVLAILVVLSWMSGALPVSMTPHLPKG